MVIGSAGGSCSTSSGTMVQGSAQGRTSVTYTLGTEFNASLTSPFRKKNQ